MKPFGSALIVTLAWSVSGPAWAFSPASPILIRHGSVVQMAAIGDPPGTGRRRGGGGRKTRASKSATPGVSSTKGVSQEDADKLYKQKYGF